MKKRVLFWAFSVVWAAVSGGYSARAQEAASPGISTERPTAGYSPDLIPSGSFQIENGAGVSLQRSSYVADLPESFLRYGIAKRVEVRFGTSDMTMAPKAAGLGMSMQSCDTNASLKFLVADANRIAPKSAVLSWSLPTGAASLTSGSYDPGGAVIWTQTNKKGYFANEELIATLTTLNGARRPIWSPSVAGGKALSESVSVFGEYAPNVLQDRSLTYLIDGGFAVVRHKLQQWDFRAGLLHDGEGYHTTLAVGYSVRGDRLFGRGR